MQLKTGHTADMRIFPHLLVQDRIHSSYGTSVARLPTQLTKTVQNIHLQGKRLQGLRRADLEPLELGICGLRGDDLAAQKDVVRDCMRGLWRGRAYLATRDRAFHTPVNTVVDGLDPARENMVTVQLNYLGTIKHTCKCRGNRKRA